MKRIPILLLSAAMAACQGTSNGGGAATQAGGAASAPAQAAASGFNFQGDFRGPLGVQLYSVRNEMAKDVPGTLTRLHQIGFREVETAGTYGMSAAQFRQQLDRAGLRATAMHVPYERLRDSTAKVLEDARTLGAEWVGVAWIPHEGGKPFTVEMARRTAADFNRFGRAAREAGLKFFYHIHGYEFRPTPTGQIPFDVMVAETDPRDVFYEMDVFWAARPGVDPAALLRKYPNRWKLMHIKDMRKGTPTPDYSGGAPPETEVPVGTGAIDYREVLKAAQEIGLERFYIEDETSDPLTTIPQSTRWLESVRY